ncbi:MAG: hypothetical protein ACKO32_12635 [Planctomycetia bacterium]
MGGSFETREGQTDPSLAPIRVPIRRENEFEEACNLASELPGWKILRRDEAQGLLVCERSAGWLGGCATVTIRVEGPEGLPSATVHTRCESKGGLLSRDKTILQEFTVPFWRRVC